MLDNWMNHASARSRFCRSEHTYERTAYLTFSFTLSNEKRPFDLNLSSWTLRSFLFWQFAIILFRSFPSPTNVLIPNVTINVQCVCKILLDIVSVRLAVESFFRWRFLPTTRTYTNPWYITMFIALVSWSVFYMRFLLRCHQNVAQLIDI